MRSADILSASSDLSAMENIKTVDWRTKRIRIEHGDCVTTDLMERAKKLGVIIVQNPTHLALPEMLHARFSPVTNFRKSAR
jgi:predicted amidohydrolase YtcJ